MEYVLGIDQGGSKTYAIVVDITGRICGLGKSAGSCHSSQGLDYAMKMILEASDSALQEAGLQRADVTTVMGGLTGIDWDDEAALLERAIGNYFPTASITVVNDCIIAMKAATHRRQCGILCAGSGLNCAVQNGEDCFTYGFYIPDEHQGGCSLGKMAVQAVLDSHMGLLERTLLTERLLEFFHVNTVDELLFMRVKGDIQESHYLKLPLILEATACKGDKVAADIWKNYGKMIVSYLHARMEKMGMLDADADIVLSGSIFKCGYRGFQDTVKNEILRKAPNVQIIEAMYEPIVGAAVMGLQSILGEVPEDVFATLEESSCKYPLRRLAR